MPFCYPLDFKKISGKRFVCRGSEYFHEASAALNRVPDEGKLWFKEMLREVLRPLNEREKSFPYPYKMPGAASVELVLRAKVTKRDASQDELWESHVFAAIQYLLQQHPPGMCGDFEMMLPLFLAKALNEHAVAWQDPESALRSKTAYITFALNVGEGGVKAVIRFYRELPEQLKNKEVIRGVHVDVILLKSDR